MQIHSQHPDYVIIDQAFSQSQCRFLEQRATKQFYTATEGEVDYDDGRGQHKDLSHRRVWLLDDIPNKYLASLYYKRVVDLSREHFGLDVRTECGDPDCLVYLENCKYDDHSDALHRTETGWTRSNQRVVSSVLYLSDYGTDFTGGEFVFSLLDHTILPVRGRMLLFRSDSECMLHRVNPVSKGRRTALVNWYEKDTDG